MKFATMVNSPAQAIAEAAELEAMGADAIFTNEAKHDPFVMSALAAERATKAEIMTYIAVAFARTPMLAAHSAHDINALSKGRFTLGLGSQIKPHIERRYGMPWSHPAPRMKEFIEALHAIWDHWYDGKPLKYEGKFYSHTLTSPMFVPQNPEHGRPKVGLGAVGPEMTKVAAEVADALLCHSFTSPRYLREVTLPAVESVLAANNRLRAQFRIVGMPFFACGETDEELGRVIAGARRRIAFYASTPAYFRVLACHGFEDIHPEMLRLSKLGEWEAMGRLVSDDMLDAYVIVGSAAHCAREVRSRYQGIFDLVCGYTDEDPGMPRAVLRELARDRAAC